MAKTTSADHQCRDCLAVSVDVVLVLVIINGDVSFVVLVVSAVEWISPGHC